MFERLWGNRANVGSLVVRSTIVECLAVGMWRYKSWIVLRLSILEVLLGIEVVELVLTEWRRALRQRSCIRSCLAVEAGMCWSSGQVVRILMPSLGGSLRRT